MAGTLPASDPEGEARAVFGAAISAALFPRPLIPAAVLLPLVEREAGLTVLLTRRTENLRDHPGQISFPGGRLGHADSSALDAALRETAEEIGVARDMIEIAGFLPAQPVITGFAIVPVVGFMPARVALQPDPVEVAEIFEIPLDYLLDPGNASRTTRQVAEGVDIPTVEFCYGGHRIWGATANIINSLIKILR